MMSADFKGQNFRCSYTKAHINLYENLIILCILILLLNTFWKWTKVFLAIVLIELIATFLIIRIILSPGIGFLILTVFVFFVGETLILISSLYVSLRSLGAAYRILSLI